MKFIASLLLIVSGLLLFSCSIYNKPDNLISKQDIVKLLVEIHLGDAIIGENRRNITELYEMSPKYYNYIYTKYNISRKQFDESMDYYAHDPDVIDEIYDKVIEEIKKQQEANKPAEEENKNPSELNK